MSIATECFWFNYLGAHNYDLWTDHNKHHKRLGTSGMRTSRLLVYSLESKNLFFIFEMDQQRSQSEQATLACINWVLILQAWTHFIASFNMMPVAALVGDRVLCMHGGLSPTLNSLEDITNVSECLLSFFN